jgi:hypothetical protein
LLNKLFSSCLKKLSRHKCAAKLYRELKKFENHCPRGLFSSVNHTFHKQIDEENGCYLLTVMMLQVDGENAEWIEMPTMNLKIPRSSHTVINVPKTFLPRCP